MVEKVQPSQSKSQDNVKAATTKEKKDAGNVDSPAEMMAEMTKTFDPQKFLAMAQMEKGEIEELASANIEMVRAFGKMFETWSAGFSDRMEERVHTLEEMAKCESQFDSINLQAGCMQRLARHWMADNQKLTGMYFDTMSKSFNKGNGWLKSSIERQSEKFARTGSR